jgi:hypothetical protein
MHDFLLSLLNIVCEMAPYLLLGFLIAGVLHVFVPKKFYANYLSRSNRLSVLWAALLGIPLPLCSCGVIPTAVSLKNEKASKGAVASFLIATPQTGVDSILATYSLMGLVFAAIGVLACDREGCNMSLVAVWFGLALCALALLPLLLFSLIIFLDASIRNRSLWVGLLSVPASFIQLTGYGCGFLSAFWKRMVLKRKDEGFDGNEKLYR